MSTGIWRLALPGAGGAVTSFRLARGDVDGGPTELLAPDLDVDDLLAAPGGDALEHALDGPASGRVPSGAVAVAPVAGQEVWAAGVTFERSREARKKESGLPDPYDLVYEAERPELFPKAMPGRVRGHGEPVGVRADSEWDVPEPELALVLDTGGIAVAYTIGNDVSSRSIEGENPLYLPQAKVYDGSCAIGPCLVPVAEAPAVDDMVVELTIARDGDPIFRESGQLSRMRRRPSELADWLYRAREFPVGAVLLTGTSIVPGPELTLRPGDVVTIDITGLGRLANPVTMVGRGRSSVTRTAR